MARVICPKDNCLFNDNNECSLQDVILGNYPYADQPAACTCFSEKLVSKEKDEDQ